MVLKHNHYDLHIYIVVPGNVAQQFCTVSLSLYIHSMYLSACMSACMGLPMIQEASPHSYILFQCVLVFARVCVAACMLDGLLRQPASSLTFHSATISTFLLYISLSSSILHCFGLHQGKCQCTHLGVGLASQSRPGYIQARDEAREPMGERERGIINQAGPQTPAAGRLARNGAPES